MSSSRILIPLALACAVLRAQATFECYGVGPFPLPESIEYLRRAGVTHVVVDTARLSRPRVDLLPQAPGLHLWATEGTVRIYLVEGEARR